MEMITAYFVLVVVSVALIPFTGARGKGIVALCSILAASVMSSVPAVIALTGTPVQYLFEGSQVTGVIPVRFDALSGWFILIINLTFITGTLYGMHYLKAYASRRQDLSLHWAATILAHTGLLGICVVQNSLIFLMFWELMAITTFLMVIFESEKPETLKAGINYLIQSHISVLLLMLGFIWVAARTGSFRFSAIRIFAEQEPRIENFVLFLCFFAGFGIKAGLVPFHTWLPHAHPAAPSHVSGMMSGVIIKIGIFGILKMLLLIRPDFITTGLLILTFGVISGVYGVMLAIVQHNIKKLLAYHSIENIGIIAIGIGLGCLGLGSRHPGIAALGFAGALLHTLNHALFKSLLFYGAGNIYQHTHTLDMERMGGLGRTIPRTSLLFLIAALAICGLPPFNGFVSEFLIYNGMFSGLGASGFQSIWALIFAIFGLALIGGMALFCFTKAYGIMFLGTPRANLGGHPGNEGRNGLIPMYVLTALILAIGMLPGVFVPLTHKAVNLFLQQADLSVRKDLFPMETLRMAGAGALVLTGLAGLIFWIRSRCTSGKVVTGEPTWGCGYAAESSKAQYTASSFARSFRKLAGPLLSIDRKKADISGVFPGESTHATHPGDKTEIWLIDLPLRRFHAFIARFSFLQNGSLQGYILYGLLFITLVLTVPVIAEKLMSWIDFLKGL